MGQKYKEGDEVYAKIAPTKKLIVLRYIHRIYYCRVAGNPSDKKLAYFARELNSGN